MLIHGSLLVSLLGLVEQIPTNLAMISATYMGK
jgi:hypothetical protein